MSDRDNGPGDAGAVDDASLFNAIVGGPDEGADAEQEQHGEQDGPDEGDRGEDEGEQAQARERDEQGRFAKRDEPQDGRQDRRDKPEDRAQRGLRGELTGERGKRQAAETRLEAERRERENDRRELARLQGIVEAIQRGQQPQQGQPQSQKVEAAPDRYTDPEGYDRWIKAEAVKEAQAFYEQQASQRAEYSLELAKSRDPQAFDAAAAALRSLDPQTNAALRQRLLMVPDAGSYLLDWHRQEQARREIGADPNAFRERVRSDLLSNPSELMKDPAFAKAMTDYLRQQAGNGGFNAGSRTETRLPPTLNGARGSNNQRGVSYGNSDRDVFEETMRT